MRWWRWWLLWNKVSPAFPYLDDVRSGADDSQVRASFARSEENLQIFAVGVSIRKFSWLSFVVETSTSSFDFFCVKIRFLQPSVLMVNDCKPVLLGVFPQPMFFLRLLDLLASSEWFLRSSKPCVAMVFAGVPFPYCFFSIFFKLRWTTNNRMKKTTRELFSVILFSLYHLMSSCPSIVLPIVFLDMNKIWDTFLVSFSKKNHKHNYW